MNARPAPAGARSTHLAEPGRGASMVRTYARRASGFARRQSVSVSVHLTEPLEVRRLLSDNPIITIDWNGQQAQAKAGEWILSLDPSASSVQRRPLAVQER